MSLYYGWLEYEYLSASPIQFMVSAFGTVFYVVVVFSASSSLTLFMCSLIQQRLRETQ